MSAWRKIAIERLPMLRQRIAEAADYYALWIELHSVLEGTYESQPHDDKLISALYAYASYCLLSHDADMATAVAVCFYEHLPLDPAVRHDMARWLSADDFEGLMDVFRYHLNEKELNNFVEEFYERERHLTTTYAACKHLPAEG